VVAAVVVVVAGGGGAPVYHQVACNPTAHGSGCTDL
jgi:hypothetical protein